MVAALAIVTVGIVAIHSTRQRRCARQAFETAPFDAIVWAQCTGPHRIAIARQLVDEHRLVGRSVADAIELLGPIEVDRNGHVGWHLGEPEGSPSLFPNELLLGIEVDHDHVVDTRMVDEFEDP